MYYWIVGIISSLVIITVFVTTGVFCIRKCRKNTLAFIDDNMQPTPSNGNPFIDENTSATTSRTEVGNFENNE